MSYHPWFIAEEIVAEKGEVSCPKSHKWSGRLMPTLWAAPLVCFTVAQQQHGRGSCWFRAEKAEDRGAAVSEVCEHAMLTCRVCVVPG